MNKANETPTEPTPPPDSNPPAPRDAGGLTTAERQLLGTVEALHRQLGELLADVDARAESVRSKLDEVEREVAERSKNVARAMSDVDGGTTRLVQLLEKKLKRLGWLVVVAFACVLAVEGWRYWKYGTRIQTVVAEKVAKLDKLADRLGDALDEGDRRVRTEVSPRLAAADTNARGLDSAVRDAEAKVTPPGRPFPSVHEHAEALEGALRAGWTATAGGTDYWRGGAALYPDVKGHATALDGVLVAEQAGVTKAFGASGTPGSLLGAAGDTTATLADLHARLVAKDGLVATVAGARTDLAKTSDAAHVAAGASADLAAKAQAAVAALAPLPAKAKELDAALVALDAARLHRFAAFVNGLDEARLRRLDALLAAPSPAASGAAPDGKKSGDAPDGKKSGDK